MIKTKQRPVFINLFQIKLPIAGIMSIGHRIAGVLIILSLPFWLYLLDLSLTSEAGFAEARAFLQSVWLLPVYLGLAWALMHHLLAGIRYLLLDIDIGVEKPYFRQTALAVLVIAPVIMLLIWGLIS